MIIGLMSGTSLDGLDIAHCEISGQGQDTEVKLKNFLTLPYTEAVRKRLVKISSVPTVAMDLLCYEHTALAKIHAERVMYALTKWNLDPANVDCIASHGQTVYHLPARNQHFPDPLNSTLQISDGDHIAARTGIITISDFRQKHTANGGEGAPLAALADRMLFHSQTEDRVLLNIGGIGNFTLLERQAGRAESPFTTDTGPGNTLINKWVQKKYNKPYDKDSVISLSGKIHSPLVHALQQDSWFRGSETKTTGPEYFHLDWLYRRSKQAGINPDELPAEDVTASLTELTAVTISDAVNRQITRNHKPVVYVSGGGVHNPFLMQRLKIHLKETKVNSAADLNISPDAKEAIIFAVLANEMLAGEGFPLKGENGEVHMRNLGKISFPS